METLSMIWELVEAILAGAGLMAFIIFGRWNYCLGKLIKEQKASQEK